MLLEDLNEDCLEEIFKYLSPMDLINLYKWNKIFLEIPSQTKVFEDFCERLSIIDKKILAKNSVQLHDFGNNICNTALFRFIDNLQCTSNMADILDKLGLKNVPYHRINDVEILIEILQLKDSATSWGSLQIRDNQDLNFYWRKRIGGIDLVGGDGCSVADNPAYVLPSWSDHMYESFFGDYTQWYLQTIFRNWLFAENVPNSILKTFKSKCNLLPTNEGRQISGKINYEKLLHHNQSILEDLKKVLGENEINEECLRFTESPEEYLDNIRLTILAIQSHCGYYDFYRRDFYNAIIDNIRKETNKYLYKKDLSVHLWEQCKPAIITKFVKENSDVEYFGILWKFAGYAHLLLLAKDDLVLLTLA